MQLEAVTAELRPRSDWEAVDLGLALTRRDFGRLLACWWLGMAPIALGASPLLFTGSEFIWLAVVWWWIPIASRMTLFFMSRRLFGERPTWTALFRELPRAMGRRFFFRMIRARLSPWRPLGMPVEDLEGLRGGAYSARVKLLMRRGDSILATLTMWRVVLTVGLIVATLLLVRLFLSESDDLRWQELFRQWQDDGGWAELPATVRASVVGACVLAMCLTDIFATGAGFGIYVNHRTWIEGWDVEIALRRLGNRLRGVAVAFAAIGVFILASAPAAHGQSTDPPDEVIRQVKADPDFKVHEIEVENPASSKPSSPNPPLADLGPLGEFVGWSVLVFVLAFGVFLCWRYRSFFKDWARAPKKGAARSAGPAVRVVMGMDVAPESLPKDIPGQAMELWLAGRKQEALGLLYRGAISRLIETARLEIAESDTESDCLRRVAAGSPVYEGYFGGLTRVWMRLAYARITPHDQEVGELCSAWPFASPAAPAGRRPA